MLLSANYSNDNNVKRVTLINIHFGFNYYDNLNGSMLINECGWEMVYDCVFLNWINSENIVQKNVCFFGVVRMS